MSATITDYRESITCLAECAIEDVECGYFDDISNSIAEQAGDCSWVIHKDAAYRVIYEMSENGQVGLDEVGWEGLTSGANGLSDVIRNMARYAVRADIAVEVERLRKEAEALAEERAARAAWEAKQQRRARAQARARRHTA